MMSFDSFLLLHAFLSTASLGCSLRLLKLQVPSVVDVRDKATLVCRFDLQGDRFLSLKWYKEELEFFRYMPDYIPRIQTFPVDGVHLLESESNVSAVTLSPLEYATSGTYRCEVSAEAPHFKVVYRHANMTVLGLPREDPRIDGIRDRYVIGSYVTANCTSSPSHPPASLDWYINGAKAQYWFTDQFETDQPGGDLNLETRTIGLKFQTDDSHLESGKDGFLSLACSATVADRTRTTEVRTQLSRLTREKFAQKFTNCCGIAVPTFYVIVTAILFPRSFECKSFLYYF